MASLIGQIADAVTAELNDQTFSLTFTAVRKWVAQWKLEELRKLRITVVPGPATWEALTRGADEKRADVDIIIQQRADPSDNTAVDPLAELLEELVGHFRGKSLTAGSTGIVCTRRTAIPGQAAAIAETDALTDWRTFTAVLRTHWILRQ